MASFDSISPPPAAQLEHVEKSASAMQQRVTAIVQARFLMALKYPRDVEQARQEMLKECCRPSFCMPDESKNGSSVAVYRLPRGKEKIEGVTIRFAEMAKRAWRNLTLDLTPLSEDEDELTYEVTCTDLETNNTDGEIVVVPKTVEKKFLKDGEQPLSVRLNSYSEKVYLVYATDDEIQMRRNARVSKAKRNLIMANIPGWLVEECKERIRTTARDKDAQDPDAAKRKVFDAFAQIGITAEQLASYLGHSNALTPSELETLRDYYGAIREGVSTWADIMASRENPTDEGLKKELDELLNASGRDDKQKRSFRTRYTGRMEEAKKYLLEEAAKKQQGQTKEQPREAAPKEADTATTQSTAQQTNAGSNPGTQSATPTATSSTAPLASPTAPTTASTQAQAKSEPKPQPAAQQQRAANPEPLAVEDWE